MKQISKQEAVEGLIQVFSAVPFEERKEGSNFYSEKDGTTSFYIDKRNCERYEAIQKAQVFFKDKVIVDGQCRIDSITLVWTILHVEDRNNGKADR